MASVFLVVCSIMSVICMSMSNAYSYYLANKYSAFKVPVL